MAETDGCSNVYDVSEVTKPVPDQALLLRKNQSGCISITLCQRCSEGIIVIDLGILGEDWGKTYKGEQKCPSGDQNLEKKAVKNEISREQ